MSCWTTWLGGWLRRESRWVGGWVGRTSFVVDLDDLVSEAHVDVGVGVPHGVLGLLIPEPGGLFCFFGGGWVGGWVGGLGWVEEKTAV